jgi:predicted amidohydrolase
MDATIENPKSRIRVATVNFRPLWRRKAETLAGVESVMRQAAARGCDLVVFPEMALNSWSPCEACGALEAPCADHLAEGERADGPVIQGLAKLAQELDLYAVVGFIERDAARPVLYNAAALVGPDGLVGVARKIHLGARGAVTEGYTCAPGREIALFQTRLGPIGVTICFDIWLNPEIAKIMSLRGARLILAPTANAATTEPDDLKHLAFARARENLVFVVMANLVGDPQDGHGSKFLGHGVVAGPAFPKMATVLAEAGPDEGFCVADLDLGQWEQFDEAVPLRRMRLGGRYQHASDLIAREYAALAEAGARASRDDAA